MLDIEILRKTTIAELWALLSEPRANGLFSRYANKLDGMKEELFKGGGKYGRSTWNSISETIYGQKRIGSDGAVYGVYSSMSEPLKASGKYYSSFQQLSGSERTMTWGSSHELSDRIPYAGWQSPTYKPRYAMPSTDSVDTVNELRTVNSDWLRDMLEMAEQRAVEVIWKP